MTKSEKTRKKPEKPYPSFPLTAHNNGQWCKKIRCKVHFFGIWADPQAALDNYLRVAADLHAGRQTTKGTLSQDRIIVKDLCNQFLTYQFRKAEVHEITTRWFEDCRRTIKSFAKFIDPNRLVPDLRPDDFEKFRLKLVRHGLNGTGKGLGVHALNRSITIVKSLFKYAYENDIIDRPTKYGKAFQKPSASLKRKSRQASELKNGKRLFQPSEIKAMLEAADTPLRVMILLGINGGFGNTDCARLPIKAINFDRGIIEFNRPKTGIERVVPLWPETLEALCCARESRSEPADEDAERLILLTTSGRPWVRENIHRSSNNSIEKVVLVDMICHRFDKFMIQLGFKRKGIGFYTLRHTFRTWADEVRDQHAIHRIMGHIIPGMSGIYVEEIKLHRLKVVTDHVRSRLFSYEE